MVKKWSPIKNLFYGSALGRFRPKSMNPSSRLSAPKLVSSSRAQVPQGCAGDIEQILISAPRIHRRVMEMAQVIAEDYHGKRLIIVALLNGTVLFLADLVRHFEVPLSLDLIGVSSYRGGTSSGELEFTKRLKLNLRDQHVLVVDDILDTGKTLRAVSEELSKQSPASLKTCVLLDKPEGRTVNLEADYVGFIVPHLFVVGYGLDYDERYRNLPFVGVLHPHVYRKSSDQQS